MPRRTIRVSYQVKVTRRIEVRQRFVQTYRPQPVALVQSQPQQLTTTRRVSASPLMPIRQAVADYTRDDPAAEPDDAKSFDVFICHASEDKAAIAGPLAQALREEGLAVWYDDFELRIGDRLRHKIDTGLRRSRFGVVVLSPASLTKSWPNYELDGLVTLEMAAGKQLILPVWHNVTKAEVIGYSPSLASRVARSSAETSIGDIAREIAEVARR